MVLLNNYTKKHIIYLDVQIVYDDGETSGGPVLTGKIYREKIQTSQIESISSTTYYFVTTKGVRIPVSAHGKHRVRVGFHDSVTAHMRLTLNERKYGDLERLLDAS